MQEETAALLNFDWTYVSSGVHGPLSHLVRVRASSDKCYQTRLLLPMAQTVVRPSCVAAVMILQTSSGSTRNVSSLSNVTHPEGSSWPGQARQAAAGMQQPKQQQERAKEHK
jgi:hypothetical protein